MNIVNYCKDSYNELVHNTTWPSRSELTNSAVLVLTASVLIALVIFVMDLGFSNLLKLIYGLF
ncbi:MAG: preprotein translocase subunit SecE [Bacteroidaceae bacterium]|nr:preprotein translocase subunit SecE [Bacteroidaceae bacterium]